MAFFEMLNNFYLSQAATIIMVSAFVLAGILLILYFILTFSKGRCAALFPISFALLLNGGLLYMARAILQMESFNDFFAWFPTAMIALVYLGAVAILIVMRD